MNVCLNILGTVNVCLNVLGTVNVCLNVSGTVNICLNVLGTVNVCLRKVKFAFYAPAGCLEKPRRGVGNNIPISESAMASRIQSPQFNPWIQTQFSFAQFAQFSFE